MARGEKEKDCLDAVLRKIDDNNVYYGFKSSDDITDLWMEEDDFKKIIKSSKPNTDASKFPDFIFDKGFIEHFQITSSVEDKGGSIYKKDAVAFDKKYEENLASYVKSKDEEAMSFNMYREDYSIKNHSHENLLNSLRKNIDSHIKSLAKYEGNKDIGIFIIQYTDEILHMTENLNGIEANCSYGDLQRQEHYCYYRMSRDIEALDLLYEYKDKVKYVIFVGDYPKELEGKSLISQFETISNGLVEIFRVDKIQEIKKWIVRKFDIYSPYVKHGKTTMVLTGSLK